MRVAVRLRASLAGRTRDNHRQLWTYRNLPETLLTDLSLVASRRSIYCDAMRYFFHIVGGSKLFPDELGRNLLTLESAKRHAKVLAEELRKGGDFCGSCFVRVVDEQGNTLHECSVSCQ
jgi:hypothetical protein